MLFFIFLGSTYTNTPCPLPLYFLSLSPMFKETSCLVLTNYCPHHHQFFILFKRLLSHLTTIIFIPSSLRLRDHHQPSVSPSFYHPLPFFFERPTPSSSSFDFEAFALPSVSSSSHFLFTRAPLHYLHLLLLASDSYSFLPLLWPVFDVLL